MDFDYIKPNSFENFRKEDADAKRLKDSVTLFLGKVVRYLSDDSENLPKLKDTILNQFSELLYRVIMTTPLLVIWSDGTETTFADITSMSSNPRLETKNKCDVPINHHRKESQYYSPLYIEWFITKSGIVNAIKLTIKNSNTSNDKAGNVLYIVNRGKHNGKWKWFISYLPGLKLIVLTLNALLGIQMEKTKTNSIKELTNSISELMKTPRPIPFALLQKAKIKIKEINSIADVGDIYHYTEDLCIWLLQEICGSGWTVQFKEKREFKENEIEKPFIKELMINIKSSIENLDRLEKKSRFPIKLTHLKFRLSNLGDCFLALSGKAIPWESFGKYSPPPILVEDYNEKDAMKLNSLSPLLALLPLWCHIHEQYRSIQAKPTAKTLPKRLTKQWKQVVDLSQKNLRKYLSTFQWELNDEDTRSPVLIRNWLQLWFFLQIIEAQTPKDILPEQLDFMRAELSYAFRECIRFACFGDRFDYVFQPAKFNAALLVVVDYHAHWIVGLPGDYEIRRVLENIGEEKHLSEHRTPEEHLQHVINLYLFGHFLLSLQINYKTQPSELKQKQGEGFCCNNAKEKITVSHILAKAATKIPGSERVKNLKHAFSLAALFHDIGHILLPFSPQIRSELQRGEPDIKRNLEAIELKLKKEGAEIVKNCVKNLEANHYFDLNKEKKIAQWLTPQEESGKADHGLLSAWYLHQVCSGVLDHSSEAMHQAVRAVLFHNAVTVPIDSNNDPVAALLVLCDELSDWEHTSYIGSSPSTIRKSLHIKASAIAPHHPKYRWLRFKSLDFSGDETTPFSGKITLTGRDDKWPKIIYELQNPERLDSPPYIYWLIKAQNIGRIIPSSKKNWAPEIIIRGNIPSYLVERGLNSKILLGLLVRDSRLEFQSSISRWLSKGNPFKDIQVEVKEKPLQPGEECIRLHPYPFLLFRHNISESIPQLEQETLKIIKDFPIKV